MSPSVRLKSVSMQRLWTKRSNCSSIRQFRRSVNSYRTSILPQHCFSIRLCAHQILTTSAYLDLTEDQKTSWVAAATKNYYKFKWSALITENRQTVRLLAFKMLELNTKTKTCSCWAQTMTRTPQRQVFHLVVSWVVILSRQGKTWSSTTIRTLSDNKLRCNVTSTACST